MSVFSDKLSELMKSRNVSDEKLGELVGVNRTTITRWRSGERSPKMEKLPEIASIFGVDPRFFVGEYNNKSIEYIYNQLNTNRQEKVYNFAEHQLNEQNRKVVPMLGATAANPTELSYGDTVYGESITTDVPKKADGALVVKGDSMEPMFSDGSIVFYRQQANVENGDLAIIEIDGDGVTFKKVYFNYDENIVILRSLNSKYEDREMKPEEIRVIGKVIK